MKNLKKTGGLLIAIGMLAAAGSAFAQSSEVKHGQSLWESNGCYLCHGTVAGGGVGPAVATDLVPYVALAQYVRHPTGEMPPFSVNVLSDADLQDIYSYLKSLPQPKSPDSNPLLPKPVVSGGGK
ncbi:cytochrome c [Oxalobacteraceae bacterium CAVE-383]|nr:cytochrome c [Oxalobacteraceae bacterium CAVE-383]